MMNLPLFKQTHLRRGSTFQLATGCATDVEFAEKMLIEAEVALVPGSAFGTTGHMRLSYATSMENLETAISRLAKALS